MRLLLVIWSILCYTPTHPPIRDGRGVYWNLFVRLSVCSSVRLSDRVRSMSPEPLNHFIVVLVVAKLGIVVYYHKAMCHAEKLVHYFQCQGHSEGLYNQNMTC